MDGREALIEHDGSARMTVPLGRPVGRASSPADVVRWVRETLQGDTASFGQLSARFEKLIFRTSYHLVGNEADALDVVQNTLIRSYKGLRRYDPRRPFRTWILAIAVNEARRLLRRRRGRRTVSLPPGEGLSTPPSGAGGGPAASEINEALDSIPEKERTAFVLRYVENHTPKETAELMRTSERTVRRLCGSARTRLRKLLGGDEGD